MFKIIFLLLSTTLFLFSNPIKFKEEKYINALQSSVNKNGVLKFEDNFIEIIYQGSDKSFIFYDDYIGLKTKEKEEILKYEENMELTIFSKLIKSIYKNQQEELKEHFGITDEYGKTILIPNEYLSNAIQKIEYKKIDEKLEFLKIYFSNEDWISIVQVN